MAVKFLTGYPALFISDKKILVVSDLHIGLEAELLKSGIKIHKQIERFKEMIDSLTDMTGARTLVVLGDVKHKVPGTYMQEIRDIPKFFEYLSIKLQVIVTAGNHDDFISALLPSHVKLYGTAGFVIDKYGFFHGHAWPDKKLMSCDYLFIGHLQPAIEFRDSFGYRLIEQAWIRGTLDKKKVMEHYKLSKTGKLNAIVVPSFNRMVGGMYVNTHLGDEIGPLMSSKIFNLGKSAAYLLDGTSLGLVKDLAV